MIFEQKFLMEGIMKKSLSKAIFFSAAILGLGVQVNNLTTVHAAGEGQQETKSSESSVQQSDEPKAVVSSPTNEGQDVDGSNDAEDSNNTGDSNKAEQPENSQGSEESSDTGVIENIKDPEAKNQEDNNKLEESDQPQSVDPEELTDDLTVITPEKITPVVVSKTNNRTNVSEDGKIYLEIKPLKPVEHTDDPAQYGNLFVPYVYHGNSSVYELDENNNPIEDPTSDTGYKMKSFADIYGKDYVEATNLGTIAGNYTGTIYSATNGFDANNPVNKKQEMLVALQNEGAFFMKTENHGYDSLEDLETYIKNYQIAYENIISKYNDDGTLRQTGSSNNHNSVNIESSNSENLELTVTTIKQATLYTLEGEVVGNRALIKDSTWRVDKVAMINGQKMYRVTPTEWVSAKDVR